MILKDDFYTVASLTADNEIVQASLELNPAHPVFEGHFPGQPVVPGVCMVQMIKEILETVTGKNLMLKQSDHIKFLSVINPVKARPVQASVQYSKKENDELHVVASLSCEERVCLKLKGVFAIIN
jgi:3-hydroxyacyl-[acyl-carrier-protein] dehydratase